MAKQHRSLMLEYQGLCTYEVALLTEALSYIRDGDWALSTVAAERTLYTTEDHLRVQPDNTFDQIDPFDYDLIILPGIDDFRIPLADHRNIDFLRRLNVSGKRPLIAAMSSSPVLLAKAGLLDHTRFMAGFFEEMYPDYPFIPKQNLLRQPVVRDNGIITASGQFFREFAIETLRACGFPVPDDAYAPARKTPPYTAEKLTYWQDPTHKP